MWYLTRATAVVATFRIRSGSGQYCGSGSGEYFHCTSHLYSRAAVIQTLKHTVLPHPLQCPHHFPHNLQCAMAISSPLSGLPSCYSSLDLMVPLLTTCASWPSVVMCRCLCPLSHRRDMLAPSHSHLPWPVRSGAGVDREEQTSGNYSFF